MFENTHFTDTATGDTGIVTDADAVTGTFTVEREDGTVETLSAFYVITSGVPTNRIPDFVKDCESMGLTLPALEAVIADGMELLGANDTCDCEDCATDHAVVAAIVDRAVELTKKGLL